MSCFFNFFYVKGWFDKGYLMTPKRLYKRILKDSEVSTYGWITSATELVNICRDINFPKEYARGIKICILNCFAELETKKEIPIRRHPSDDKAVYYCYNSLDSSTDDEALNAKRKYFSAVLDGIIKYNSIRFQNLIYAGESYKKVCKDWKKDIMIFYFKEYNVNFERLKGVLQISFFNTIITAKKNGLFEKDEKKHWKDIADFARELIEEE